MDPLTQGLLGATFGQACFGRALGRRAVVWGALAGMLPDADIAMNWTGPLAELRWHRGPTHALWFGLVAGPPLALAVWRIVDRERTRLAAWVGLFVVALFTHPLLDLFTTYGTQLLTPFARTRFALDAVAIIDPAYSILLIGALAIGWRRGFDGSVARRVAIGALVLSTGYLFYGLQLNRGCEAAVREALRSEGVVDADVRSYPTLLQLPIRRVVVRNGSEVRVGWMDAWTGSAQWEAFHASQDRRIALARATPEGRLQEWFADGQTVGRVRERDGLGVVDLDDLRYGIPGRPRLGLWGLRFVFDDRDRIVEPIRRIHRYPSAHPGRGD